MTKPAIKTVFIETLGCAMNERDSEHMIAELRDKAGYQLTDTFQSADLILINTCSVREKPVSKLFSELGVFNKKKKDGAKIGVCGCTASHLGKEIIKRASYVDFVIGARNVSKIVEVLDKKHAVEVAIDYDDSTYMFSEFRGSSFRANINISIGCDKECTFCIVPHTRGQEVSIPANLIVEEVTRAVATGIKEVTLLGQNVNNYGRRFSNKQEKVNFSKLLNMVSEVDGLARIRFTSPHPFHADDEFIETFANNKKVAKHMHLPLQSGSTHILKMMKRGYSKEWFLNKVNKMKKLAPGCSISTDIIVGFPGESDADFEDTLDVIRKVRFEQIFSFKYSSRPHTQAAEMTNIVDPEIADIRLQKVQALHKEILAEIMEEQIGKEFDVLFEELKEDGKIFGKSDNFFNVVVKGSESLLGETKRVYITGKTRGALEGNIIN
jgi:tRNA-2-methylthio-N6-dimethylallyladenosine synthase